MTTDRSRVVMIWRRGKVYFFKMLLYGVLILANYSDKLLDVFL